MSDWLVSEGGRHFHNDDSHACVHRDGDSVLVDIYKMLGRMEGIQQDQSESMKRMSEVMMRFVAQEDMIAKQSIKVETLTEQVVNMMQDINTLRQQVEHNKATISEHKASDVPVSEWIVSHMTTIVTALLVMLGTTIASKLPEIIAWFRGL